MAGSILARAAQLGRVGAAWLSAYVAVGGLAGFVLARSRAPFHFFNEGILPARCWPELGLFDMIQTRCAWGVWDLVWFLAVGAPRLLIGMWGLAVTLAADAVRRPEGFDEWWALAGLVVVSASLVFGYFVGVAFWWRQSVWMAVLVGLCLALDHGIYGVGLWS